MKHKIVSILTVILLLSVCAGCKAQPANKDLPRDSVSWNDESADNTTALRGTSNENPKNGDELLSNCIENGAVKTLLDNSCVMLPTKKDGNIAMGPAAGYEEQWETITVTYDEDCVFQIAYVNTKTGAVRYDPANMTDIKKNTSLIIYGEYDNDHILHATRVYIYRGEG